MHLVNSSPQAATALLDRIAEHVPGDEACTAPNVIHGDNVMITETDERFAVEIDTETGRDFVTRTRVTQPGIVELTVWQSGQELTRRTTEIGD